MNKRGQEELTSWEFAKGVVLLVVIISLLASAYRGIPDSKLNPLKAEDLSLTISSVFIVENDFSFDYDLGDEYFIDIDNNRVRLYKSEEGARGISELFLDKNYNFGEQVSRETKLVHVKKEGNKVVVS